MSAYIISPVGEASKHMNTVNSILEAMEKEGLLKREQGAKGQWYVTAADAPAS